MFAYLASANGTRVKENTRFLVLLQAAVNFCVPLFYRAADLICDLCLRLVVISAVTLCSEGDDVKVGVVISRAE